MRYPHHSTILWVASPNDRRLVSDGCFVPWYWLMELTKCTSLRKADR